MLFHVHKDTALFPDYSARKRYVNNNNIPQEEKTNKNKQTNKNSDYES